MKIINDLNYMVIISNLRTEGQCQIRNKFSSHENCGSAVVRDHTQLGRSYSPSPHESDGTIDECPYGQDLSWSPGEVIQLSKIPSMEVSTYSGQLLSDTATPPTVTIHSAETVIYPQ